MTISRWIDSATYKLAGLPLPLLLLGPTGIVFLVLMLAGVADTDLFARVAVGHLISEIREFPFQDPFSFAPRKEHWIDHEWLSGVLFNAVASRWGDSGLLLLAGTFGAATAATLALTFALTGTAPAVGIAWLSSAIFLSGFLWSNIVRSHCVTFLFFALELFGILSLIVEKRALPLLLWLLLFPLWVNCHGGFVIGLGVLGISTALAFFFSQRKRGVLLVCLIVASLLVGVNPYGYRFVPFIIAAVLHPRTMISEWAPLDPLAPSNYGIMLFLAAGAVAIASGRHRLPLRQLPPRIFPALGLLLTTLFLIAGFRSRRLIPFALFTLVVFGGPYFTAFWEHLRQRRESLTSLIRAALVLTITMAAGAGLGWSGQSAPSYQLDIRDYPARAVNWLRNITLPGKVLVSFNDGSFALWRLFPKMLISVDGRYEELYPDTTINMNYDALNISPGESHTLAMGTLDPDYIMVCQASSFFAFHNVKKFGPHWREIYTDEQCRILAKNGSPHATQIPAVGSAAWNTPEAPLWQPLPKWADAYRHLSATP